ncbi:hypothetical protein AD952_02550 [Acetobacter cerevisiae]|uniref:Uncharacterized protein n=1 Tax=Acetobacter cerevisiae TaxID=178900 RepID=A0A149UYC7_9PROT|nr:hypothetical protein AD952_02550 [Acetobacter cerevisiae]
MCGKDEGGGFILDEKRKETGRLRLAGITPDEMNVIRSFKEALPFFQSNGCASRDLHGDPPFQDIDKHGGIMSVDGV